MAKPRLPLAPPASTAGEPLGRDTVMDRGLALRYGADYVHLVAFAIDVDRVREALEEDDPEYDEGVGAWPFAWEVFLTERYLARFLDPTRLEHRDLVAEAVDAILDAGPGDLLGAQLTFAVRHAVRRGTWPPETEAVFRTWRQADDVGDALDPLYADPEGTATLTRDLARACLEAELDPPLVAPTRAALERLAEPSRA